MEKLAKRVKRFKLLGEAKQKGSKGSSFLEKLEQKGQCFLEKLKRFKLLGEAKTKVQKVQASSRS